MRAHRSETMPVLVLNFADNYWQHGALGIARSLGRMGVPVHFIQEDPRAPAAVSRYVVSKFDAGLFSTSEERAVENILRAGERLGQSVLIPTDDVGVALIAEHGDTLQPHFLFPRQSGELVRSLSNKRQMYELCRREGIDTPETFFPGSREEAADAARTLGFPCVVKGIDASIAYASGTALGGVTIVQSEEELLEVFDAMQCPGDANVLVQEHVPGEPSDVWMFNGYFDEASRCLFAQTGRKLRQHPPYTGMTTLGECAPNAKVHDTTIELMSRISYRGPLDLGYRHDHRDGSYKLLDVNPRMGGTFRLFVDPFGMDTARATYLDLTGRPVEYVPARDGRTWVVENFDLSSARQYVKDGRLTRRRWIASLAGVDERAWFARDDLRPFLRMCRKFFVHSPLPTTPDGASSPDDAATITPARQTAIVEFFDDHGGFWGDVYDDPGVEGDVYRRRRDLVLSWAETLPKGDGALLDLGCGTGVTAIPLARAGWRVSAIDPSEAMVAQTIRNAEEAGVGDALAARRGDAHELDYPTAAFDVVVAVGVLPWLHSPGRALSEVARVLRPGGLVILTSDNRARATKLLHPMYNPLLSPLRRAAKAVLERAGLIHEDPNAVWPHMYYERQLRLMLAEAGLIIERGRTVGFGPFTIFGKTLGRRGGRAFDRRLQAMADAGRPLARSLGAHHVVLARKP